MIDCAGGCAGLGIGAGGLLLRGLGLGLADVTGSAEAAEAVGEGLATWLGDRL